METDFSLNGSAQGQSEFVLTVGIRNKDLALYGPGPCLTIYTD